jgi:hypothetical protein
MSVWMLASLAFLAQAPEAPQPLAQESRVFHVSNDCGHGLQGGRVVMDARTQLRLRFTSDCAKRAKLLVQKATTEVLQCTPAAAGSAALNVDFALTRDAELALLCTRVNNPPRGTFKYRIKSCIVTSGETCNPGIAPLTHELEIHIPDK